MRLRYTLVALAAAGSLIPLACGGDDKGSSSTGATTTAAAATTTAAAAPVDIVIKDFAFQVNAAKAGTITVRNDDTTKHTVTSDDGTSFSVEVPAGQTVTIPNVAAGTYAFHCEIHPTTMKGTLVVA
jgi:plastocyanin